MKALYRLKTNPIVAIPQLYSTGGFVIFRRLGRKIGSKMTETGNLPLLRGERLRVEKNFVISLSTVFTAFSLWILSLFRKRESIIPEIGKG